MSADTTSLSQRHNPGTFMLGKGGASYLNDATELRLSPLRAVWGGTQHREGRVGDEVLAGHGCKGAPSHIRVPPAAFDQDMNVRWELLRGRKGCPLTGDARSRSCMTGAESCCAHFMNGHTKAADVMTQRLVPGCVCCCPPVVVAQGLPPSMSQGITVPDAESVVSVPVDLKNGALCALSRLSSCPVTHTRTPRRSRVATGPFPSAI